MIAIFPELAACAASGDLEKLAILCRQYFGGEAKHRPRVDVAGLVETFGIAIRRAAMPDYGALVAKDEHGRFEVVALLPQGCEEAEERFLLAHLCGHFILHVQPGIAQGQWTSSGFREKVSPLTRYIRGRSQPLETLAVNEARREREADEFAAALLLPKGMIIKASEKIPEVTKLARFFGVPEAMVARRLACLRGLGDVPVNFLEAEKKLMDLPLPVDAERIHPSTQDITGITGAVVPRAFAASSYGAMKRAQEKPVADPTPEVAVSPKTGLDRLREIARRLDKSNR